MPIKYLGIFFVTVAWMTPLVVSADTATFTTSTNWTAPSGVTSVQYLIVAGGGGGGSGYGGGGGGAGGVLAGTLAVTPGNSYTVTIGAGGAGAPGSANGGYGTIGTAGGNSVFASLTAIGGGAGAYGGGGSGGSGGGGGGNGGVAGGAGTSGQGYNGGAAVAGPVNYGGGGGGGKGGAGAQAPSSQNGGAGGSGYVSSISGVSRTYAAGGGGGGEGGTGGAGGSSNTGGHGGGGGGNVGITSPTYYGSGGGGGGGSPGGQSGTAGYQGIVILSYTPVLPSASRDLTVNDSVSVTGNVTVVANLAKGSGTFLIDHPTDPANKLLYHSFVESPDALNEYVGTAIVGKDGDVTIRLPDYFEALNGDPQYFIRALDMPMSNLFVKQEVKDNEFVVGGGSPGGEISWMVTGIRHDPYILAHPIIPEVEKGPGQLVDKGEYIFQGNAPACSTLARCVWDFVRRFFWTHLYPIMHKIPLARDFVIYTGAYG